MEKLPAPTEPSDWIFLATLNEELISKEIKLISDRVSWLTTSQGFLFSAFCLLLISRNDKTTETANTLLFLIPVIALCSLVGISIGIFAAELVMDRLATERTFYTLVLKKIYFDIDIPDLGSERKGGLFCTGVMGRLPYYALAVFLFVIWTIILLGRVQVVSKDW